MTQSPEIMWFDPLLRAKTNELAYAVQCLRDALLLHETDSGARKRARKEVDKEKFGLAVEALACNLILLSAIESGPKLAVPRSHGFLWRGDGSANPVYGQHFLSAIDGLASLGLIEEEKRGYRLSARMRVPSLIRPSAALAQHLPLAPPGWRSVKQIDDRALIILKEGKDDDGRAATIAFPETARTRQLARQMRRINESLRGADIEVTGQNTGLSLGKDGQVIAPYRRSLRRIFNNDNWQHGGRLAGGFWMGMERAERFERIRIDGERIADVDYRQLFPRLAYVRAGQPQPEGDIYNVAGDGSGRDGWKRLMNAMLFSDGPLRNWPEGTLQHFPPGTKLRDAIEMLATRHAPIADLFGTGLGFQLMRIESDMLIGIITHLANVGVTALPLHDAVLVSESKAYAAADEMQAAFSMGTGSSCAIVSIEFCPQ
ncbi:hypothetical protein GA0061099_1003659 [Bradyrhizobium yuanmingense]|uniref:Uncharacterized protein n=2 Tax=Bradyrhizobium yuanmingense TaxID=108015 RepID=A0A1C3VEE3_9BRAD|nr:hypothetical protein IQ15_03428 [Bradyrhizobium yuanmingense]SCB25884.1 hypothetical protein GA0061099_1003659 [Bradyrhizobium yuanmingense]